MALVTVKSAIPVTRSETRKLTTATLSVIHEFNDQLGQDRSWFVTQDWWENSIHRSGVRQSRIRVWANTSPTPESVIALYKKVASVVAESLPATAYRIIYYRGNTHRWSHMSIITYYKSHSN